jgi:hypothetical protein
MTLNRHIKSTLRLRPLEKSISFTGAHPGRLTACTVGPFDTIGSREQHHLPSPISRRYRGHTRPTSTHVCINYQHRRGIEHADIYVRAERLCSNMEDGIFSSRLGIDETISKSSWI